ncbi:MAG: TolC family protein [Planctomycetota bacterium]
MNARSRAVVLMVACSGLGGCRMAEVADPAPSVMADVGRRTDPGLRSSQRDGELDEPAAVALALERNPRIRQALARAGVAQAELVEALTPENPRIGVAARWPLEGAGFGVDLDVLQDVISLLFRPRRGAAARARFDAERQDVVAEIVDGALEVSEAWYTLVTARQLHAMRALVEESAGASEAVAGRMADAGTLSRLGLARESATHAQAAAETLEAEGDVVAAREHLLAAIAADPDQDVRVPDVLPAVPATELPLERLLETALCARADLRAARAGRMALAHELGLARQLGSLGTLEGGAVGEREVEGAWSAGPAWEVEIPLFDQGQARRERAASAWRESTWAVRSLEAEVRRDVRTHRLRLDVLRKQVELHARRLIPARERVVALSQQEYDFMLLGVDKLLEAKREEYEAYARYVTTIRDYWIERVHLERAVGVRLQVSAPPAVALPKPGGAGDGGPTDHGGHDGQSMEGGM